MGNKNIYVALGQLLGQDTMTSVKEFNSIEDVWEYLKNP